MGLGFLRRATSWLGKAVIGLALACATSLAAYIYVPALHDFTANLFCGFIGTLVTVFLIENALEKDRRIEREKFEKLATFELMQIIGPHLDLLVKFYKATVTSQPSVLPKTLDELINDEYLETIGWLDFDSSAPVSPSRDWNEWVHQSCAATEKGLSEILIKFGPWLTFELAEAIQNFRLDEFFRVARMNYSARRELRAEGSSTFRLWFAARDGVTGEFFVMAPHNKEMLRQHCHRFGALIAAIDSSHKTTLGTISPAAWHESIAPRFGSGRFSTEAAH